MNLGTVKSLKPRERVKGKVVNVFGEAIKYDKILSTNGKRMVFTDHKKVRS